MVGSMAFMDPAADRQTMIKWSLSESGFFLNMEMHVSNAAFHSLRTADEISAFHSLDRSQSNS